MADVKSALKDLVGAVLGIATFAPPTQPGPELGDSVVTTAREALGGRLEPIPHVRLRWYPPDIERAQLRAQTGDLLMIGQLNESMKLDGVFRGLSDARASVVNFPRRIYGSSEVRDVLLSKNNSDRDVYNEMVPSSEARLMVVDEMVAGVAIGEMVPVEGRDFPVLVRRYVQNLFYLWSRNQWYYRSIVGLIPITPGVTDDKGNGWVLHIGGGRLSPWNNGLWNTLGRSYINKTQSLFARQSYEMKHSHPARVATSPLGATEEDRQGMLAGVIRWALNAAFALPVGWDLKLIESNGQGIKIYDQSIKNYNEEMATALCGSSVMLQGTAGFSNMDVFKTVATDLIRTTSSNWDHCVNTQILPSFIARRWGVDALKNATTIETDVSAPSDRKVEADTLTSLANAVKGLVEAIGAAQIAAGVKNPVALDISEILARFGVPTKTGAPMPKPPPTEEGGGGAPAGKSAEPPGVSRALALLPPWSGARALAAHVDPVATLAVYREEDHPRDESGRFSSHGSRDAADASKEAHESKSPTAHKKASKAHETAAAKHRKEAERRKGLASKEGASKAYVKRHKAAASRHEKAATEHDKLADHHAKQAGGEKKKKAPPKKKESGSPETKATAEEASKKAADAEKSGDDRAAADAHRQAAQRWAEHSRQLQNKAAQSSGPEKKALLKESYDATAKGNAHFTQHYVHETNLRGSGKERYKAAIAESAKRDAESAKTVGKAKTAKELGIETEGSPQMLAAYDSAIQHGRFDKLITSHPVKFSHTEKVDPIYGSPNCCYVTSQHRGGEETPKVVSHGGGAYAQSDGPLSPEPLGPRSWGTTSFARDAQEARTIVMTHELSHHLHFSLGEHDSGIHAAYRARVEPAPYGSKDYGKLREGQWVASNYAAKNHLEWFAETHTAFVHAPDVLQKNDPDAYRQMIGWRKRAGM